MTAYNDDLQSRPVSCRIFAADLIDVVAKCDIDSIEHPIISLFTRSDRSVDSYRSPTTGVWIEVAPSMFGRATIFDEELLLYFTGVRRVIESASSISVTLQQ